MIIKAILGILLGEATGIGPELVAKLCATNKFEAHCRPVLIGDARVLEMGKKIARVDFPVEIIEEVSQAKWGKAFPLLDQKNFDPTDLKLGEINRLSGKVTGDMLITAMKIMKEGLIDGLVYAPLHKAALRFGGHDFEDEQKLMTHYLEWDKPASEMNVLNNLWTSRVTSHIPLENVCANLSIDAILRAIRMVNQTLRQAGIEHPRVAVAAVNPHGGESGLCGRQEIEIIAPAVEIAQEEGIVVMGPYPSDTVFINAFKGQYDAVVTMFHDQGQIAMKLMGFQFGVTVAGGLPYAITTPAHGTAFDIVGQGIANPDAFEQAVVIASKMVTNKKKP